MGMSEKFDDIIAGLVSKIAGLFCKSGPMTFRLHALRTNPHFAFQPRSTAATSDYRPAFHLFLSHAANLSSSSNTRRPLWRSISSDAAARTQPPMMMSRENAAPRQSEVASLNISPDTGSRTIASSGWTPRYARHVTVRFEADVFPAIGSWPIAEIEAPEVLDMLRKVEGRRRPRHC